METKNVNELYAVNNIPRRKGIEKAYSSFSEFNIQPEYRKKLILVPARQKYLIASLQGFCYVSSCQLKLLSFNDASFLLEILKNEMPSVVFLDRMPKIVEANSSKWEAIRLFLQENNIALYGIGKLLSHEGSRFASSFHKIFIEPLDTKEIIDIVNARIGAIYERRFEERRKGGDRRRLPVDYLMNVPEISDAAFINGNNFEPKHVRYLGRLVIDYDGKAIMLDGEPIRISPKEFRLIDLLAQKAGCVVDVEEILKAIWTENSKATKADVHQYMYLLRHKLEKNPHKPHLLISVKGFGYKLSL